MLGRVSSTARAWWRAGRSWACSHRSWAGRTRASSGSRGCSEDRGRSSRRWWAVGLPGRSGSRCSWASPTSSTAPPSASAPFPRFPSSCNEGRLHRLPRRGEDHALLRPRGRAQARGRPRGHGQGGRAAEPAAHQPQDLARGPDLDPHDAGGGGDPLRRLPRGGGLRPQRARQLRLHGPGLRSAEALRALRRALDEDVRPALQGADLRGPGRGRHPRHGRVLHALDRPARGHPPPGNEDRGGAAASARARALERDRPVGGPQAARAVAALPLRESSSPGLALGGGCSTLRRVSPRGSAMGRSRPLALLGSGALVFLLAPPSARAAEAHPFADLAPGSFQVQTQQIPVRVVLVGFGDEVDTSAIADVLPAAYQPVVRYPLFYDRRGRDLGLDYRFHYRFERRAALAKQLFAYLKSAGTEGPITAFQEAYNEQGRSVAQVRGPVLHIDAAQVEKWLAG